MEILFCDYNKDLLQRRGYDIRDIDALNYSDEEHFDETAKRP
jgi:hypothetical protein